MLRVLLAIFLLTSCSLGSKSKGGTRSYLYRTGEEYNLARLKSLAHEVVSSSRRAPPKESLDKLFSREQADLRRIGILVFESKIQDTRSGLASEGGRVYPTASGKQLITEKFLNIWEEGLPIADPELDYVPTEVMKKSEFLHRSGAEVEDHVKTSRTELSVDDIVFLEKGKRTALETILNPRGMRDFSFVMVPASELMGGPKWSEHQKHMVNEVATELKLDALLVIMSEARWESKPEVPTVKIEATTLIPFSSYKERLAKLGVSDYPAVNVAYRSYQGALSVPIDLTIPEEEKNFRSIEERVLNLLFATYRDLAFMTMLRMKEDWEKTR